MIFCALAEKRFLVFKTRVAIYFDVRVRCKFPAVSTSASSQFDFGESHFSHAYRKFPVSPKVIETLAPPHRHHLASNSLDLARNKPGKKKNRLLIREGKESSENHRKKSRNSVTSSSRIYQPRRRARNINFSRVIRHSCKKGIFDVLMPFITSHYGETRGK